MELIGTGQGLAAYLNGRAKGVTPKVVRALERALPQAQIFVSSDFDQARRHVQVIAEERPYALLVGGGDGTCARLLNELRRSWEGALPPLGLLKLGTGNGWANAAGSVPFQKHVTLLPKLPRELPTTRFNLLEVEGSLCQFAGVGWDAQILNDYLRNLDKRSSQLFMSRFSTWLHMGLGGYFYSLLRITVPEEVLLLLRKGPARVTLENLGEDAFALDATGQPVPWAGLQGKDPRILYEGPLSVGGAATTEEWGFGLRSYPFARGKPGYLNLRVYDRPVLEALPNIPHLYAGRFPQPGMHDFFTTHARMTFSRRMPFQIAGDGEGMRQSVEYRLAEQTAGIVDWSAAQAMVGLRPS
jgi:hypothetical protein